MQPLPLPAETPESDAAAESWGWRVVSAAAAWARRASAPEAGAPAREGAFGIDAAGSLVPIPPESPHACLYWREDLGWTAAPRVPVAARALLELYLPICAASARRPLTVAHLGQSLDGHIATASGDSYYVTGPENVRHLHRLRALCDAVVVGAGTIARDDPQLTVRQTDGRNPVRVVLDPRRRLGVEHRVFADARPETLLISSGGETPGARHGQAEIVAVPSDAGRLRLDLLLERLHARGLSAVFVEGGGVTVSSFLAAGVLDRLHVAIAPLITGSGRPGLALGPHDKIAECLRPRHRVFRMGGDLLFDCDLRAPADVGAANGVLRRVL
jgi:riboflavin-specific deaminase-like protein